MTDLPDDLAALVPAHLAALGPEDRAKLIPYPVDDVFLDIQNHANIVATLMNAKPGDLNDIFGEATPGIFHLEMLREALIDLLKDIDWFLDRYIAGKFTGTEIQADVVCLDDRRKVAHQAIENWDWASEGQPATTVLRLATRDLLDTAVHFHRRAETLSSRTRREFNPLLLEIKRLRTETETREATP